MPLGSCSRPPPPPPPLLAVGGGGVTILSSGKITGKEGKWKVYYYVAVTLGGAHTRRRLQCCALCGVCTLAAGAPLGNQSPSRHCGRNRMPRRGEPWRQGHSCTHTPRSRTCHTRRGEPNRCCRRTPCIRIHRRRVCYHRRPARPRRWLAQRTRPSRQWACMRSGGGSPSPIGTIGALLDHAGWASGPSSPVCELRNEVGRQGHRCS